MTKHRHDDQLTLLKDTAYFARELEKRVDRLRRNAAGHRRNDWEIAGALARRIRRLATHDAVRLARRRAAAERAERYRAAGL
jgi:hypothetical protein